MLLVMNRFAEALPLLQSVTADLDEATGESRDAALAHALGATNTVIAAAAVFNEKRQTVAAKDAK